MEQYQSFVRLEDVPDKYLRGILQQIIDHLELVSVAEITPDYKSYTLKEGEA